MQGIDYLRKQLKKHQPRVETRYKYYDMKYWDSQTGITIPPALKQNYKATMGWCSKAVDCLADRLIFRGFDDEVFNFKDIFFMNNPDLFFDSAILSALIASCCFVYISEGSEGVRLQVIEASNATGAINPITNLLEEGYAILKTDDKGKPELEAYFIAGRTDYYENGKLSYSIANSSPAPLLVPVIHRPDAVRPFGRSRITRSAMYYQKYAKRTLERADITAEFYSFPQKYVVGMDPDAEPLDTWKATVTSMLQISKGENNDKPTLGQFTTPSMSPFTEQLRTTAALFAGETGLTLDDLGFVSDNPSSAEAIKASHETLRAMAKKAQRNFGSAFVNVGYIACCLRDDYEYKRHEFMTVKPRWYPVFEPDAAMLSSVGDGAIKINQAVEGFFDAERLSDLTGLGDFDE